MADIDLRAVRVLVPGNRDTVLVGPDDEIPLRMIALDGAATTIAAARRDLLPQFDHPGPIIDCFIVQADDDADPHDPVLVLLELATSPAGWRPPDGHRWAPIDAVRLELEPDLAPLLLEILDIRRGIRQPDPLKPKWTEPGWIERASAWIERALAAAGRAAPTEIVQFRHWGISALLQVDTPEGRCWFKAVFPHFKHEPAVTALLDRTLRGSVASVVAYEAGEGWLLMEDIVRDGEGDDSAGDPAVHREPVAQLVALQRRFVGGASEELLAAGCAWRPLAALPEAFTAAAGRELIQPWIGGVSVGRIEQISDWLRAAIARIDAVGVPDTLVHGDFHPNNVALSGGHHVIFDWSDAAFTHPLIDVGAWSWWLRGNDAELAALWESFYAAWAGEPWIDAMRGVQSTFDAVAGAYHFVSYCGIVEGLDPHRRPEHAGGLRGFFKVVDDAAP